MGMEPTIESIATPPMSKEFLDMLVKAFPRKRWPLGTTIDAVQRDEGRQEVIDWIKVKLGSKS